MVIFGMRIGALILFGHIQIALWVHGNLGFMRGLRIHECEFLCYRLQILRPQWSILKRKMMVDHPLIVVEEGAVLSVGCLLIQICSVIMFNVFGDGYHVFMWPIEFVLFSLIY